MPRSRFSWRFMESKESNVSSHSVKKLSPSVVMLHGAQQHASEAVRPHLGGWDRAILTSPSSSDRTPCHRMPSRSSSWQSAGVQAVQTPDARPAAAFCTNHNGLHLGGAPGKLFGYATNVHWCVVATTPGKDRPGRDPAPISTRAPALPLGGCPRILSANGQPIQQREHAFRVQLRPCSGLHAQRCLAPARPRRLQLRTRQFVPSAVGGGLLCAARHA